MASITTSQMRKIYVTAKEYGMDNDLLHIHVQTVTGKDSLKELSVDEAIRVIDGLEHRGVSNRPGGITHKQLQFIYKLMKKVGWVGEDGKPDESRLNGFCSSMFKIDSYRWISSAQASKIIEAFKDMESRK